MLGVTFFDRGWGMRSQQIPGCFRILLENLKANRPHCNAVACADRPPAEEILEALVSSDGRDARPIENGLCDRDQALVSRLQNGNHLERRGLFNSGQLLDQISVAIRTPRKA